MTDYVTAADLKQSLELTGVTSAARDIERAIPAASRAIDELCGQKFGQDTAAVDRYYDPESTVLCFIDPIQRASGSTAVTALADVFADRSENYSYSETWTEGTDYALLPRNAAADGKPFSSIRAIGARTFPTHSGALMVTAKFGWAEIPAQVVEACVLLTNKLIVRVRQAPFGIVSAGIDSGAVMRIARTDPDVMALLEPFMRNRPFA